MGRKLYKIYFWIYNEYYRGFSVDIGGNEMVFYGVFFMEVNFDELFVVVCVIYNILVYVLYI